MLVCTIFSTLRDLIEIELKDTYVRLKLRVVIIFERTLLFFCH